MYGNKSDAITIHNKDRDLTNTQDECEKDSSLKQGIFLG